VRKPVARPNFPPGVEFVIGDLTKPSSLKQAVAAVDAIVFTHGTYGGDQELAKAVDYGGVRNVLAVLPSPKVHVALMTAISVTDRKGAHDWKRRGERLLRASGLAYTIVRPGWFDYNKPNERRLVMLQGDRRRTGTPRDGAISREQIAEVLVRSLHSKAATRKTFELVAELGPEPADLESIFADLDGDPAGALDGVHDETNMPLDAEPVKIVEELRQVVLSDA
jgi:uncharacterized protein YbjT (DUF2867 family)